MCGVALVINKSGNRINKTVLSNMINVVSHRGPDSNNYYIHQNVGLAHARLSIIDLTNDGIQPMEKFGLIISYNGEIYNYIELRQELKALNYNFSTNTDTEVILAAYHYWGKDCVNHFNGMWAIIIFDYSKNEVFVSRDRFGVKPLYFYDADDYFVIGSEIKQLLFFLPRIVADNQIVVDYLISGFEDHLEKTFFKDIKKIPPSISLIYNLKNHTLIKERFFDLEVNKQVYDNSELDNIVLYKKNFLNSIKLRLRSDVKVGTCLSGGLDSSAIAYYASKFYNSNEKFLAFHVLSSLNPRYNELSYVQDLVQNLPIELIIIDGSSNNIIKNIDEVIKLQEEPFGSPSVILQYLLMQKAKEMKCKVLLDGQGGDESLLGYERYYPSIFMTLNWSMKIDFVKNVVRKSSLSLFRLIKYILYFTNSFLRLNFLLSRNLFMRKKFFDLLSADLIKLLSNNYKDISKLQRMELFSTQLPHLLRYEDKNSMYFGIETRLPFLDYKCVQTAYSINPILKVKNGWSKYILRKSVENDLPKSIVWRKNKIGFELPEEEIFSQLESELILLLDKSHLVNKIANIDKLKKSLPRMSLRHKWRLFNLVKWELIFKIETDDE